MFEEPFSETSRRPHNEDFRGRDLSFETMEHGGDYPDDMPQAIRVTDKKGRSAIYRPIKEDGKVVDSKRFTLEPVSKNTRRSAR